MRRSVKQSRAASLKAARVIRRMKEARGEIKPVKRLWQTVYELTEAKRALDDAYEGRP